MLKKYLLIILAGLYILSPFDLIPDWIIGGGWIDDIAVLGFLLWTLNRMKKTTGAYKGYRQYTNAGASSEGTSSSANDRKKTANWKSEADPYTILGIPRSATKKEIKAAYTALAAKYHPDKVQHLGREFQDLAHEKFTAINKAYEMLVK